MYIQIFLDRYLTFCPCHRAQGRGGPSGASEFTFPANPAEKLAFIFSQSVLLPLCIVIGIGWHLNNVTLPGLGVNHMKKRKTKIAIFLRFTGK